VLFIDEISSLDPKSAAGASHSNAGAKYSITGPERHELRRACKDRACAMQTSYLWLQETFRICSTCIPHLGQEYGVTDMRYSWNLNRGHAANRELLVQFIAQEVKKDGKIPPFD
jgi:predicted ATP-dependent protease